VWPDWAAHAAGCRPDVPAVVVAANRVVAVTPAARAEGVERGLRRREAQGRCPGLEVVAADPGRDARAWESVVAVVEELTTGVEVLGPGALGFSTRGPSRYFGGDQALARRVQEAASVAAASVAAASVAAASVAAACRVGVADGRFAATLAARIAPPEGLVIPPGGSRAWLAPQPVRALGPGYEDLADLLVRLGVPTLGDLAALPGPAVLARFGPEGAAARRLASGLDERTIQGREPPPELSVAAELDPPEERVEAAAFVAKALADDLHARLDGAGLATSAVAIEVETEHGETLVRHWRHEGALSAAALAERTRWQLEGWLSGMAAGSAGVPTGGITLLRLTPLEVRPDAGRQMGFWGGTADADTRAARAMARVQGLLGPEAVVTAVLQGGRGCADQVRLVPWGDARDVEPSRRRLSGGGGRRSRGRASGRREPAAHSGPQSGPQSASKSGPQSVSQSVPWPGRLSRPSPAIVHSPPKTADLCDEQGRRVEVTARGLPSAAPAALAVGNGRFEEIVQWAGPWPLEERWWEGGGRRRARFQLVTAAGEAYLVYREAGGWWLEASYG
jgi:protein ImuB